MLKLLVERIYTPPTKMLLWDNYFILFIFQNKIFIMLQIPANAGGACG
jgi:hypothetical protein